MIRATLQKRVTTYVAVEADLTSPLNVTADNSSIVGEETARFERRIEYTDSTNILGKIAYR